MHSSWPGSFGSSGMSSYPSTCFHHSESWYALAQSTDVCEMNDVMRSSLPLRSALVIQIWAIRAQISGTLIDRRHERQLQSDRRRRRDRSARADDVRELLASRTSARRAAPGVGASRRDAVHHSAPGDGVVAQTADPRVAV